MLSFFFFQIIPNHCLIQKVILKLQKLQHDLIKSTMGIQFWIEHSSFSDVVTEVKEMQNRIEVEFKQHLSELEKIKRDVGTNESELKKPRSDYQKLLQDRNEKEKRITDLSFGYLDFPDEKMEKGEENQ